jgi:hypothetical protein
MCSGDGELLVKQSVAEVRRRARLARMEQGRQAAKFRAEDAG